VEDTRVRSKDEDDPDKMASTTGEVGDDVWVSAEGEVGEVGVEEGRMRFG